ncbi:MAG: hypothetical protein AUI58_05925 [Chloroflexi bacterium 13_1_40CM_2_70_6]|nr:MAG: hypothetical protein AUI58_05925 [Chloroflexi bacterium 13_1_40CM_2_70_6]
MARLLPWELPTRRRPHARRSLGVRIAVMSVLVLLAAGIITVGALSVQAASASGAREPTDYAVPAVLGTAVPLALLVFGWLRLRRRLTAALLAFALGLSVNVVFLANAVPADASAGTSSTFYLSDAKTTFACAGAYDMYQTAPTAAGSFSFPGGAGVKDTFCSDTFTTGMALGAGTTSTSVYMWNNSTSKTCNVSFALLWYHAATATTTSLGTGSTSLAPNTPVTPIAVTFASLAATFVTNDRLQFSVTFTSPGNNCNNSFFSAGTSTFPSRFVTATIVPEGVAGLLLLAPMLPLGIRVWKSRRRSSVATAP